MTEETKAPAPAVEASAPSERPRSDGPRHDGPRSGPRFGSRSGPGGPPREGGRKFFRRKKVCKFCVEKIENINYNDYRMLGQFVAENGNNFPHPLPPVSPPHHPLSSSP